MKPFAVRQATLIARVLASMGMPARESFEACPPDGRFVHQRVVEFDPAQFADSAPDARLSEHVLRCQDPGAAMPDAICQFLAPDVPADRGRFVEYALHDLSGGGRGDGDDFPALRSPPHRLITQRIASRGLTLEVDEDVGCLGAGWPQAKAAFLRGALDRARLRRTVALFVAGAVCVDKTWDSTTDPDADVRAELDAQPLRASRVMYDGCAWARRRQILRARGSGASSPPEELAGRFAVEEVQVLRADVVAAPAGDDGGGGQVLLFCGAEHPGRNDFSNLKTFTAPAANGERHAAYVRRVGGKRWRVGVECHETVAITSTAGLAVIGVGGNAEGGRREALRVRRDASPLRL